MNNLSYNRIFIFGVSFLSALAASATILKTWTSIPVIAVLCFIGGLLVYHTFYLIEPLTSYSLPRIKTCKRNQVTDILLKKTKKLISKKCDINITAMGTTHYSIEQLLGELIKTEENFKINAELLFLAPKSPGTHNRAILENRETSNLDAKIQKYINKINYQKYEIEKKGKGCIILKSYDFVPGIMLIEINDLLIIRFYLKEQGYFSPCILIDKGHTEFFKHFHHYFSAVSSHFCSPIPPISNDVGFCEPLL